MTSSTVDKEKFSCITTEAFLRSTKRGLVLAMIVFFGLKIVTRQTGSRYYIVKNFLYNHILNTHTFSYDFCITRYHAETFELKLIFAQPVRLVHDRLKLQRTQASATESMGIIAQFSQFYPFFEKYGFRF